MRCLEGMAMREDAKSFLGRIGPLARSQLATQAAVLLPVIIVAGLSAWTLRAPPRADSQLGRVASFTVAQEAVRANASPASVGTDQPEPPEILPAQVAPIDASPAAGLWISSQTWRRGGLGSNALVTLTLRNENDYAVKDVEIACAFSRSDGKVVSFLRTSTSVSSIFMRIRQNARRLPPAALSPRPIRTDLPT